MADANLGRAVLELTTDHSKFDKGLRDTESSAQGWGGRIGGVAKVAALGLVGVGVAAAGMAISFAKAAAEEEAGMARMATAFRNAGVDDVPAFTASVEKTIAGLEHLTAFSDGEMRDSLSILAAETGSAEEAMNRLPTAMDLARGAGIDLEGASRLLGKVTDENVGSLKRYGITVDAGSTATELLRAVQEKFGGQSAGYAKTAEGQWTIFKNQLGNVAEDFGSVLLPAATTALGGIIKLIDAVREGPIPKLIAGIGDIAKAITGKLSPIILPVWDYFVKGAREALDTAVLVTGALGEIFDVVTGKRPSAGGVLRELVGDDKAAAIMGAIGRVRDTVSEVFDALRPVIQRVIDKVTELRDEFEKIPGPLKAAFAGVVVGQVTGFNDALIGTGASAATMASGLVNVGEVLPAIGAKLALLPTAIGLMGISFGEAALAAGAFMLTILPFIALAAAIGLAIYLVVTHWEELGDTINLIGKIVGYFIGQAGAAIGDFLGFWLGVWDELTSKPAFWIGRLVGFVLGGLLNLAQGIADFAGNALGAIVGFIGSAGDAWSFFWDNDIIGKALGAIGDLLASLWRWGGDLLGAIGETIDNIHRLWNDFWNALPEQMGTIGRQIVQGLIGGIEGMLASAISTLQDFGSGLVQGLKDALGIHSPSAVFQDLGQMIMAGLTGGLKAGSVEMEAAWRGILSATESYAKTISETTRVAVTSAAQVWVNPTGGLGFTGLDQKVIGSVGGLSIFGRGAGKPREGFGSFAPDITARGYSAANMGTPQPFQLTTNVQLNGKTIATAVSDVVGAGARAAGGS